ncbi:MAG: secondary thiamine-phosphate synthase enzyme YjbQ [Carbonactinosporaceae bacterium]
MKTRQISVRTGSRASVHDLTAECSAFLEEVAAGSDGLLHVFAPHATVGVALIETGASSEHDLLRALHDVLPPDGRWRHRHGSAGHGRDHLVPAFVAPYATLPVVRGRMALGTWQSIVLVDTNTDNPERLIRLSFLGG